jgi:DNA-binding Xre family transcriptional regulator
MKRTPSQSKGRLVLRARIIMAEQRIRSITELQGRLEDIGISVSNAQLGRIVDNKAKHLSVELITGLLRVLKCTPTDLFGMSPAQAGA